MPQRTHLHTTNRLDPERDHVRIVQLTSLHEFPWDTTRALEMALFRTFAVPSVSGLLASTAEFTARAQKRYDDTDLIISEFVEEGYDSERGRRAIRRMNQLHGRFDIKNDDFRYVLSTFVFEPIRWNARFGWRRMTETERLAQYCFWREVGRRMAIEDIPPDYDSFERFNVDYERAQFRYAESNKAVGEAVKTMLLGWVLPKALHPLGDPAVYALLDPPLRRAFGFPDPPAWLEGLVAFNLRTRGRLVRLLPERAVPHRRTLNARPTYPRSYRIEELGPPPYTRAPEE